MTSPKTISDVPSKADIAFLSENDRNKREMFTGFIDLHNEFDDIKLTSLDSITAQRNPVLVEEVSNKKDVGDESNKCTILKFNQTLQNYVKDSVGNTVFNLTKNDRKQIIDTTNNKDSSSRGYLLRK